MDPLFRVELITATPNPQQCIYAAMHQDYSEGFVYDERDKWPDETKAGEIAVKRLLSGERGHFGVLEHIQITLNAGWFPHSVMQQARTHRVGLSFDTQSFRYTGNRIVRVANGEISPEEVFYLRQPGFYRDRSGKKYEYTSTQRSKDMELVKRLAANYKLHIDDGMAEEHARSIIPFDTRQHFVVSFSLRALLHFLDLRAKKDAQDEIRYLCELMLPHLRQWVPQISEWYVQNRLGKARLAP